MITPTAVSPHRLDDVIAAYGLAFLATANALELAVLRREGVWSWPHP